MTKVLIHHGEIGIKGGNFSFFEKKLMSNIKKASERIGLSVIKMERPHKRLIFEFSSNSKEKISNMLKSIPGIKSFSFIQETERNLEKLKNEVKKILNNYKKEKIKKVSFEVKRSDKNFQLNSTDVKKELGEIANKLDLKVDYSNPERTIFVEITSEKIYIYFQRVEGIGGLPVGTSGRVLVMLSGGIDSPVAAWLSIRRGCKADFLHFHTFQNNKKAMDSKIKNLVEKLNSFQGSSRIFMTPYSNYEIMVNGKIPGKYELVLFKHFMLKLAEKILEKNYYDAIVLGDSLGQVASQTIENIKASSLGINCLIFRPLITYDKDEIINLSRRIGTLDMSLEKYKDCCSILSKSPSTKTKIMKFEKVLELIDMEDIVEKTLKEAEVFNVE